MRLKVVGQGLKQFKHVTMEGLDALTSAHKVLHVSLDPVKTQQWLKCKGVENSESIKDLYETRALDEANYKNILDRIKNAVEEYQEVALLLPGHPRIGVTLVQWLEKAKHQWGIELITLPGVSSFAAMINDLKIDPLERGSQLVDANRILLFQHELNPYLDSYIYHICSVGTPYVHLDDPSRENHIRRLKSHLLNVYPESHRVTLICSSTEDSTNSSFQSKAELGHLECLLPRVHFGTTLFIPGMSPRAYDKDYLKLLKSQRVSKEACNDQ